MLLKVTLEIDGDPGPWRYTLELSGSETKKKPLRSERETVHHANNEILSRPNPASRKDDRLLTQTHLERISQRLATRRRRHVVGGGM